MIISEIASILQLGQNVDIAFMVEATTKNKENIKSLNKNIQTFVDGVKLEFPNVIVRVAIVAYRDYSDKGKHLKVYGLTSNISQVKAFLSNLKPSDKGSKTEDVLGAIEETLNLDWKSPNKHLFQMSKTILIFMIHNKAIQYLIILYLINFHNLCLKVFLHHEVFAMDIVLKMQLILLDQMLQI